MMIMMTVIMVLMTILIADKMVVMIAITINIKNEIVMVIRKYE